MNEMILYLGPVVNNNNNLLLLLLLLFYGPCMLFIARKCWFGK